MRPTVLAAFALLPALALAHDGPHECDLPSQAIVGDATTFPVEVPTLLYAGFTTCADECPTDLGRNHAAVTMAGEAGHPGALLFMSVDPAEGQGAVDGFAANWPGTVGLTRDASVLAALYATAVPSTDAGQPWVHTRTTYLVAPGVGVVALFPSAAAPEEVAGRMTCAARPPS